MGTTHETGINDDTMDFDEPEEDIATELV